MTMKFDINSIDPYNISEETGLPVLPEGYYWIIDYSYYARFRVAVCRDRKFLGINRTSRVLTYELRVEECQLEDTRANLLITLQEAIKTDKIHRKQEEQVNSLYGKYPPNTLKD